MNKCSVNGCDRKYRCSGYCEVHYKRMQKHGDINRGRKVGTTRPDGYRTVKKNDVRQYEHIEIAERALGKKLPEGAEVHHMNEDKNDNRPGNLVICPSQKYHALLHMRMRAVDAGYPAYYRKCSICKNYDDSSIMYIKPNGNHPRHRTCKDTMRVKAA